MRVKILHIFESRSMTNEPNAGGIKSAGVKPVSSKLIRVAGSQGRGGWIELIMALHSVVNLSYAVNTEWRRVGVLW
jgi:hypothetical protein